MIVKSQMNYIQNKNLGYDLNNLISIELGGDFENDYNSYKGNAYGLANTLMQTAFLKPKMQSNKLKNLFYTGQLTVPGPGVPPAIISGEVAATEIVKQFRN